MRYPEKASTNKNEQSNLESQSRDVKKHSVTSKISTTLDSEEIKRRKKESLQLSKQLEYEKQHRDIILWSVGLLQESVEDLEAQLHALETGEWDEDSEYKLRYMTQTNLNRKLEEQIDWYDDEVHKLKIKIKKGQEMTFDKDLERYTELELQQMIKNLERERNNLYSSLRNNSWSLDSQSKKYHHLKELSRAYAGDLTIVNRSLEQLWKYRSRSHDSGFTGESTPVTSPGALTWSGESGILPSQRILDPRKGPVRKTVGVRSLPRLDMEALDINDSFSRPRKGRSKSTGRKHSRAKSLEGKKKSFDINIIRNSTDFQPPKINNLLQPQKTNNYIEQQTDSAEINQNKINKKDSLKGEKSPNNSRSSLEATITETNKIAKSPVLLEESEESEHVIRPLTRTERIIEEPEIQPEDGKKSTLSNIEESRQSRDDGQDVKTSTTTIQHSLEEDVDDRDEDTRSFDSTM